MSVPGPKGIQACWVSPQKKNNAANPREGRQRGAVPKGTRFAEVNGARGLLVTRWFALLRVGAGGTTHEAALGTRFAEVSGARGLFSSLLDGARG